MFIFIYIYVYKQCAQKTLPFGMASCVGNVDITNRLGPVGVAGLMPGKLEKMWRKPCAVSVYDDGPAYDSDRLFGIFSLSLN